MKFPATSKKKKKTQVQLRTVPILTGIFVYYLTLHTAIYKTINCLAAFRMSYTVLEVFCTVKSKNATRFPSFSVFSSVQGLSSHIYGYIPRPNDPHLRQSQFSNFFSVIHAFMSSFWSRIKKM